MNYPLINLIFIIIAVTIIITGLVLAFYKPIPKYDPEQRVKKLIEYMEHERLSLENGSKELRIMANKIEQEYPYLKETIDQLRELQGCLYLMNQFFKQGNHTLDEIRDYETYLMRKFYITHHQLLDIPTNNRQNI